jgi:hypothetical protein
MMINREKYTLFAGIILFCISTSSSFRNCRIARIFQTAILNSVLKARLRQDNHPAIMALCRCHGTDESEKCWLFLILALSRKHRLFS